MWQLILGPILGIAGGAIEKFHEFKLEELKVKERQKDREHDLKMMEKEGDLTERRIVLEGEIAADQAEHQTFNESYKFNNQSLLPKDADLSQNQLNWIVFVEVFAKLIRPLTTVMYQVFIAVIFGWSAWNIVELGGTAFDGAEFVTIFKNLVYSVIGLGETTLLWWYGVRRQSKKRSQA